MIKGNTQQYKTAKDFPGREEKSMMLLAPVINNTKINQCLSLPITFLIISNAVTQQIAERKMVDKNKLLVKISSAVVSHTTTDWYTPAHVHQCSSAYHGPQTLVQRCERQCTASSATQAFLKKQTGRTTARLQTKRAF
jgi:hypothetical protein